jgi:hypothetical protein
MRTASLRAAAQDLAATNLAARSQAQPGGEGIAEQVAAEVGQPWLRAEVFLLATKNPTRTQS